MAKCLFWNEFFLVAALVIAKRKAPYFLAVTFIDNVCGSVAPNGFSFEVMMTTHTSLVLAYSLWNINRMGSSQNSHNSANDYFKVTFSFSLPCSHCWYFLLSNGNSSHQLLSVSCFRRSLALARFNDERKHRSKAWN